MRRITPRTPHLARHLARHLAPHFSTNIATNPAAAPTAYAAPKSHSAPPPTRHLAPHFAANPATNPATNIAANLATYAAPKAHGTPPPKSHSASPPTSHGAAPTTEPHNFAPHFAERFARQVAPYFARLLPRLTAVLAAPALLAALAACSGESATSVARPTAPVIVPGRPGEQARTFAPGESAPAAPTPTANAADVRFVQDMILHHRQAVDMTLLAPSRAASDGVKRLAARINDAQELEIGMMTRWLREQGQRVPHHGGHAAHADMPGMATPEQLDRLRAATGPDFDRLFVELMINHHAGALIMTNQVLSNGSHSTIQQLAADMAVEQAAEIRRMRRLL